MEQKQPAVAGPVEPTVRPEPVQRLLRYAGQTMRTARNPNMTAREAIAVGNWLAAIDAEIAQWRKLRDPANLHVNLLRGLPAQLTREQRMHLAADDLQRMAELEAEAADLRQQLADEKRQHDITRGDLERTRLACDELLAADDGRNVVIGGRPAPVAICTRMDLTEAQREQLRTTIVVAKGPNAL